MSRRERSFSRSRSRSQPEGRSRKVAAFAKSLWTRRGGPIDLDESEAETVRGLEEGCDDLEELDDDSEAYAETLVLDYESEARRANYPRSPIANRDRAPSYETQQEEDEWLRSMGFESWRDYESRGTLVDVSPTRDDVGNAAAAVRERREAPRRARGAPPEVLQLLRDSLPPVVYYGRTLRLNTEDKVGEELAAARAVEGLEILEMYPELRDGALERLDELRGVLESWGRKKEKHPQNWHALTTDEAYEQLLSLDLVEPAKMLCDSLRYIFNRVDIRAVNNLVVDLEAAIDAAERREGETRLRWRDIIRAYAMLVAAFERMPLQHLDGSDGASDQGYLSGRAAPREEQGA